MIDEPQALSLNLIIFGRVLRRFGLGAAPDRIVLFAQSLAEIGFASREDVKAAGRAVFVRNADERRRFDAAFDAFWSSATLSRGPDERAEPSDQSSSPASDEPRPLLTRHAPAGGQASAHEGSRNEARGAPFEAKLVPQGDRSFTYSFAEALGQKDFSRLTSAEVELAHELSRQKRLEFGKRVSRRTAPGRGGGVFDARRTLRASLREFGEPLDLRTRTRQLKQRDIVLLCDISGSMDRYSRLLLQFIHAMRHSLGRVEAFVFGTRLTRITRQIRRRDVNEALDDVASTVADWGGGTRIGECLHDFNVHWARRVLARGAIVIIISDGWDRGDIGLLAREMQRLQRMSYRLIWLNPLLGGRNYRPQTIGMRAALPFVDDFLPAHNLKSLAQLVLALRAVDRRRPARRQSSPLADVV
jgi:uncharacterized protein with von Willebrand factor type A (vWA) domain